MNVVGDSAGLRYGAMEAVARAAQILMRLISNRRIVEKSLAVLGGKHHVKIDLRQGLRHGIPPTVGTCRQRPSERIDLLTEARVPVEYKIAERWVVSVVWTTTHLRGTPWTVVKAPSGQVGILRSGEEHFS
jgi:hypothetical protein